VVHSQPEGSVAPQNSRITCALAAAVAACALAVSAAIASAFRRADFNQDGQPDIADAVSVLDCFFLGNPGMFRRDEIEGVRSVFGELNQVYLYFCNSDAWSGRSSNAVLAVPEDPERRYSLHFRGHDIVRAEISRLLARGVVSDDGAVAMPSLAGAELVLLSGFSAGSAGMM
jgi:hypothetical protein